jgi:hypothetical protein
MRINLNIVSFYMNDPIFLGISKSQWDLINGFANWFAAAGSFAAAAVALYIANRAAKPSATTSVGHRIIIGHGVTKPYPEFIVFHIVNTGDRPIRIVQLGWKIGLFTKRYAIQMYDDGQSSPLPIDLTHGQEASWYVPLDARKEPWLERFAKEMLLPNFRSAIWTARAQFHSSVGYVFQSRLESGLRKKMYESVRKVKNES